MRKYLIKRILFSLFSLVVVMGVITILIYKALDRNSILVRDPLYSKFSDNEKIMYEYSTFQKYGYLNYESFTSSEEYKALSSDEQKALRIEMRFYKTLEECIEGNEIFKNYVERKRSQGYTVSFLKAVLRRTKVVSDPYIVAVYEKNVFERLGEFFKNMFQFETINDVTDETLTDRYIRIEWDERSNMPALVGSGTTHKYLIYFDNKFPFVHQNFFHLRLGTSTAVAKDQDVVEYMLSPTGGVQFVEQITPKDINNPDAEPIITSIDFHSATYNYKYDIPSVESTYYPEGERYTSTTQLKSGVSKIGTSFLVGIAALFITYIVGLPLGILMAQRKDKIVDKVGNGYIIFVMAVPSLAYIYMFAMIGINLFKLPASTQLNRGAAILGYILPTISLALPSIGGLMKWMRRYMVDQKNSDYVKFARSQGLSEGEIFSKHISRNAFIFLVHGIPADILACLVGAIITERVYGVPGIGNMLTDSIDKLDNPVILGVTVFYTLLTIVALIAGDLLLAKYDPRISLSGEGN